MSKEITRYSSFGLLIDSLKYLAISSVIHTNLYNQIVLSLLIVLSPKKETFSKLVKDSNISEE